MIPLLLATVLMGLLATAFDRDAGAVFGACGAGLVLIAAACALARLGTRALTRPQQAGSRLTPLERGIALLGMAMAGSAFAALMGWIYG